MLLNFVLMDTKIFQEFKDELPPRCDSWVDWYLDSRAIAKEKGWEFNNDSVFRYDFCPLADAYHDMSARHIYSTTVGFMRAKIFEEIESFLTNTKADWMMQQHYEYLHSRKFISAGHQSLDSLMNFFIDFLFKQENFEKNHRPLSWIDKEAGKLSNPDLHPPAAKP